MPTKIKNKTFLSIAEVASRLSVRTSTLRYWALTEKVKVYRHPISKARLFAVEDIEVVEEELEKLLD